MRPRRAILVSCPRCMEVEVPVEAMCVFGAGELDGDCSYCFACPSCAAVVSRAARPRVVRVLRGAGVPFVDRPAELDEQRAGPPLVPDDLLAFQRALDERGWFDELLRLQPRNGNGT